MAAELIGCALHRLIANSPGSGKAALALSLARGQGVEAAGAIKRVADLRAALEKAIRAVEDGSPYLLDVVAAPGYASFRMVRASGQRATS